MKWVFFSDLHLGDFQEFGELDPDTGLNKRFLYGLDALRQVLDYCKQLKEDKALFFLGDLWHDGSRIKPEHFCALIDLLDSYEEDVPATCRFWMPGQHDYSRRSGVFNAIKMLKGRVVIFDQPEVLYMGKMLLVVVPFRSPIDVQRKVVSDIKKTVSLQRDQIGLVLGHFLLREILDAEGLPKEIEAISLKELPKASGYVFGDYHRSVWIEQKRVLSLGSLIHLNWGDCGRPQGRFGIFDPDRFEWAFQEVENIPKFVDIPYGVKFPYDFSSLNYYRIHVKDQKDWDKLRAELDSEWKIRPVFDHESKVTKSRIETSLLDYTSTPQKAISVYCEYLERKDMLEKGLGYVED